MKKFNKIILFLLLIMTITVLNENTTANAKMKKLKYSTMSISQTLQTTDGKTENIVIGCRCKECKEHVGWDINDKAYVVTKPYNKVGEQFACKYKSDLYNIQVKHYNEKGLLKDENGRKFDYKTIYDEGFKSMQGACLKGKVLYVAFSDKGRTTSAGADLTAIVQLKLNKSGKKYKVAFVGVIDGITVRNIYGLGHANDLYYQSNNILHSAWYKKGGTKKGKFKMGCMSDISKVSYTGNNIEKSSYKVEKIFGVAKASGNDVTLGLVTKNGKMVLCKYKFKNSAYEGFEEMFATKKKYDIYSTPQCMEYVKIKKKKKKKKDKIYVIRFLENYTKKKENNINKKLKKNSKKNKKQFKKFSYKKSNQTLLNNCLLIYSPKGKILKEYTIDEPAGYRQYKWEVESINHIKGKDFCFTIAKPSTLKRALLCNTKIS